jgi:hypothetical protein
MEVLLAAGISSQSLTVLEEGHHDGGEDNVGAEPADAASRRNVELRLSSEPEALGNERY